MELQGLGPLAGLRRRFFVCLCLTVAVAVVPAAALAGVARAASSGTATTDPNTPVIVVEHSKPPAGYRLNALQAQAIAARSPVVRAELRRHPRLLPYEYTKGPGRWQVSWFTRGPVQKELIQVYVDDASGRVTEAWTGFQVAWTMARGYSGAFGRRVTALYVWIPMCLVFAFPFLPLARRRRRIGPDGSRERGFPVGFRRPTLLHLDLLVLLSFSVSLAFFDHARIGLSVPLAYPPLLYLLARMLLLAFGRGRPRGGLPLIVPASWLAVAIVFLVGFRIGLNVTNSNVIDVGYSGVIGADKLLHDKHLYGGWPHDNAQGDTYGPVNYYAYVPFRAVFGWSGVWDDLPAAHAAAIAFDLLTLIGLFFLGRLIRGPATGIVLAYAWAAYPFTIYALESNSNDSLVALLVIAALLAMRWAPARGGLAALAGLTKFAPLALAPLLARGVGPWPPRRRSVALFAATFASVAAVAMLPVFVDGNFSTFWHHTVTYQSGRGSPFSVWGLWGGLGFEQRLIQGGAVALGLTVAVVPWRRGLLEVCALAAAVLIALQLGINHWFYLYIPWFFGLVMAAILGSYGAPGDASAGLGDTDAAATAAGAGGGTESPVAVPG